MDATTVCSSPNTSGLWKNAMSKDVVQHGTCGLFWHAGVAYSNFWVLLATGLVIIPAILMRERYAKHGSLFAVR
jgi:hypothetical protein